MKKFLSIAAIALATIAMISCQKDGKDGEGEQNTVAKRIKTFSLVGDGWADVYQYTYDDAGKLTKVFREETKQWALTYAENVVTITNAENKTVYTLTLNEKGYCEKMVDEWDEFTYTYNSKDQMTEVKKNGEVASTIALEDGCIVTWTRMSDGELQTKVHTYMSTKNLGSIHNIRSEKAGADQWLFEAGFFGKGTTYLCSSSQWQHSDAKATYEYEFDEDGYVTKELKDYPDWPETFEYSWETINK